MAAVCANRIECVWELLSPDVDVNLRLEFGRFGSALAAAAACGNTDCLSILIEAGADPDLLVPHGYFGV